MDYKLKHVFHSTDSVQYWYIFIITGTVQYYCCDERKKDFQNFLFCFCFCSKDNKVKEEVPIANKENTLIQFKYFKYSKLIIINIPGIPAGITLSKTDMI